MRTLHMLHALDCEVGSIGVTFRNGLKWSDSIGELIELCICAPDLLAPHEDHRVEGHAKVVGIWAGPFADLPAQLIEHEHEESSRVYSGLLNSMRRAYGPDFSEYDTVVGLSYRRID